MYHVSRRRKKVVDGELIPILQSIIVATGNIIGIIVAYLILERRTERKMMKYWKRIKASEEGKSMLEILAEGKKLLKSPEGAELIKEAHAAIVEFRGIMKNLKERMEESPESEVEEEDLTLPSLHETRK